MAAIQLRTPVFNLLEIKTLLLQIDASIGLYTDSLLLIGGSSYFLRDFKNKRHLLFELRGTNLEKATLAQQVKQNTTVKITKYRTKPLYIDLIWFLDEKGDYYCLAFAYVDNYEALKQHTNNFALLHSNYHREKDIVQNILSASYCGTPSENYAVNNLSYVHKEAMKLIKLNSDNEVLTDIIADVWPIKLEIYNCLPIIHQIVDEYKNIHPENTTKFNITANNDEAFFYCDRFYFTKALSNIFANIIMYSGKKSEVIDIDIQSDWFFTDIRITDNKLILNERVIDEILSGRLDKLDDNPHYGLYLANSIILRHKGSLTISSNVEIGTEITIRMLFNDDDNGKKIVFRQDSHPDDKAKLSETITSEILFIE